MVCCAGIDFSNHLQEQERFSMAEKSAVSKQETIGVGFIGVGGRGQYLLRLMLTIPGVVVTALSDADPKNLAKAAAMVTAAGQKAPATSSEWKALLARADVQAVVSALPCDLHAACYLDTIAAGKDLYGEKPMCLTVADCDAVVAAANKADKQIVQIGFQRRADPRFIEPMEQIHAGELGTLVEGRVAWLNSW
jgi:myo-inositol 2-dehydrogenase/D-chiro-inositol 1-dehydrogenase